MCIRDRGKSVGRYLVCVSVRPHATQIAMLEGRTLVEHYVSRAADETTQIDGNIYWGRVQNVLPGMEAAFIDIGIPKNAVLYRGDVRYDRDDIEAGSAKEQPRIEDVLRACLLYTSSVSLPSGTRTCSASPSWPGAASRSGAGTTAARRWWRRSGGSCRSPTPRSSGSARTPRRSCVGRSTC